MALGRMNDTRGGGAGGIGRAHCSPADACVHAVHAASKAGQGTCFVERPLRVRTFCSSLLTPSPPPTPPFPGLGAYTHHAEVLGFTDPKVDKFVAEAYAFLCSQEAASVDNVLGYVLKCGEANLWAMELLDKANTTKYGDPVSALRGSDNNLQGPSADAATAWTRKR